MNRHSNSTFPYPPTTQVSMKTEVEQTLKESIARQKMLSIEDISLDSSLEELGVTSLDSISLVFDIEDKYGIEIPNEALKQLRTVRDIVDGVEKLLSSRSA